MPIKFVCWETRSLVKSNGESSTLRIFPLSRAMSTNNKHANCRYEALLSFINIINDKIIHTSPSTHYSLHFLRQISLMISQCTATVLLSLCLDGAFGYSSLYFNEQLNDERVWLGVVVYRASCILSLTGSLGTVSVSIARQYSYFSTHWSFWFTLFFFFFVRSVFLNWFDNCVYDCVTLCHK